MKKNTVGYCWNCGEYTEHRVIECKDTALWRTFETVFTLGFAILFERDYYCECKKCGRINTLNF